MREEFRYARSSERRRLAPRCACGQSNKSGKYVPVLRGGAVMRFGNEGVAGYCFECARLCVDARTSEFGVPLGPPPRQVKEAPRDVVVSSRITPDNLRSSLTKHLRKVSPNLSDSEVSSRVDEVWEDYGVGGGPDGITVFWVQERLEALPVTAQAVQYRPGSINRDKSSSPYYLHTKWEGAFPRIGFGSHLLEKYPDREVGIVEAPKTALIAAIYRPERVWIATIGASGIRWTLESIPTTRFLEVYPDNDAVEGWKHANRARTRCKVYSLRNIVEDAKGDLADYLIQQPLEL